jgi:hypothetical protein
MADIDLMRNVSLPPAAALTAEKLGAVAIKSSQELGILSPDRMMIAFVWLWVGNHNKYNLGRLY